MHGHFEDTLCSRAYKSIEDVNVTILLCKKVTDLKGLRSLVANELF